MLLQEIRTEIPVLGGVAKMDKWEVENYAKAKKDFVKRLATVNSETANPAARIFQLMDELTAEYYLQDAAKDIVCRECRGGWCCMQLVCCTTLEMLVIQDYLAGLPRETKRGISRRVRKHALKFSKLHQATFGIFGGFINGPPLQQMLRTKKLMEHYYEKPCPYLNSAKRCSIYPARPLDCRIAKTRDKICGPATECVAQNRKIKLVRLMFEQVATNLLMDEEMRIFGQPTMVPLAAWPLFEPFRKMFF